MPKPASPLQNLMKTRQADAPTVVERPIEPGLELLLKQYQLLQTELAEKDAKLAALNQSAAHTPGPCPITGLANGPALDAELAKSLATAKRYGRVHGLIALEMPDYPGLASVAPGAGDELLRHIARLIRQNIRPTDIAARPVPQTGAPQRFFIILNELRELENLTMRAQALAGVMAATPCVLAGRLVPVGVVCGCQMFGADDNPAAVVRAALAALAAAVPAPLV